MYIYVWISYFSSSKSTQKTCGDHVLALHHHSLRMEASMCPPPSGADHTWPVSPRSHGSHLKQISRLEAAGQMDKNAHVREHKKPLQPLQRPGLVQTRWSRVQVWNEPTSGADANEDDRIMPGGQNANFKKWEMMIVVKLLSVEHVLKLFFFFTKCLNTDTPWSPRASNVFRPNLNKVKYWPSEQQVEPLRVNKTPLTVDIHIPLLSRDHESSIQHL